MNEDDVETFSIAESFEDGGEAILTRPIVVGYVFGPKKMSTMGVVMAEASKTNLCTPASLFHIERRDHENYENEQDDRKAMPSPADLGLTKAVLYSHEGRHRQEAFSEPASKNSTYYRLPTGAAEQKDTVVFTIDGQTQSEGGLRNIVRYFRSSCSSIDESASTGTCTASTASQLTANTAFPTLSSSASSKRSGHTQQQYPVRVSFVPLDPELPIEEQHGGRMDIILHKLTEDILCLSQLTMENPELKHLPSFESPDVVLKEQANTYAETEVAAIRRVHRLCHFQKQHPECCIVDDPVCVQTLMSRSDIADTLKVCLQGLTSTSGVAVSSPNYAVISPHQERQENTSNGRIMEELDKAGLTFPIIVKPLTAAGTKASHSMAVLMDPSAVDRIMDKAPCLCQEYSNHDSLLYKVYVLGDHVSVHKRRSLPNLPKNAKSTCGYLEFDSQRPYPRLSDFGYYSNEEKSLDSDGNVSPRDVLPTNKRRRLSTDETRMVPSKIDVNEKEIRPVVEALKQAFGLELFGFDILITSKDSEMEHRMLVVDVNYFPSYKEVPNFPALLARYLTDRAIESRRKAVFASAVAR